MISILLFTIAIPVADVLPSPSPTPEGYMESFHLLQEAQDYNSFFTRK